MVPPSCAGGDGLMASPAQREARVREGSRRKRDQVATASAIDWQRWVEENLPDAEFGAALIAVQSEYLKRPHRQRRMPTADEVRSRLERAGRA